MKRTSLSNVMALGIAVTFLVTSCKKTSHSSSQSDRPHTDNATAKSLSDYTQYADQINAVCSMHNEAMDMWYSYATELKTRHWTGSAKELDTLIRRQINAFFQSKGWSTGPYIYMTFSDADPKTALSPAADAIIKDLDDQVDLLGAGKVTASMLSSYCTSRLKDCHNLADEAEALETGLYCAMIGNSGLYWDKHLADFITLYNDDKPSPAEMNTKQKETLKADANGESGACRRNVCRPRFRHYYWLI